MYLSNTALKNLSDNYNLPVKKLVGDLDYSIIRNCHTPLTEKELAYCENDCLVLYHYIKFEKETNKDLPLTYTGHVRQELKSKLDKSYKNKVRRMISTDPILFNRFLDSFARRLYT